MRRKIDPVANPAKGKQVEMQRIEGRIPTAGGLEELERLAPSVQSTVPATTQATSSLPAPPRQLTRQPVAARQATLPLPRTAEPSAPVLRPEPLAAQTAEASDAHPVAQNPVLSQPVASQQTTLPLPRMGESSGSVLRQETLAHADVEKGIGSEQLSEEPIQTELSHQTQNAIEPRIDVEADAHVEADGTAVVNRSKSLKIAINSGMKALAAGIGGGGAGAAITTGGVFAIKNFSIPAFQAVANNGPVPALLGGMVAIVGGTAGLLGVVGGATGLAAGAQYAAESVRAARSYLSGDIDPEEPPESAALLVATPTAAASHNDSAENLFVIGSDNSSQDTLVDPENNGPSPIGRNV